MNLRRIQFVKVLLLLLVSSMSILSCKDKSYDIMPKMIDNNESKELKEYKTYSPEELTGNRFSTEILADIKSIVPIIDGENKTRGVGFKENSNNDHTEIDWITKTNWNQNPPTIIFRFVNHRNGKIFYVKSTDPNQIVRFEKKDNKQKMRFSLQANLPQGVTSLVGWKISCFIADNIDFDPNSKKINFEKIDEDRILQPIETAQLNIPFSCTEVNLVSNGGGGVKPEMVLQVKPLGTILTIQIKNELYGSVEPTKLFIKTNLFTDAGYFTWNAKQTNNLQDCFDWTPEKDQYSISDKNKKITTYITVTNGDGTKETKPKEITYLDLSKELTYNISNVKRIQPDQNSNKYVLWCMPTPLGSQIEIEYEVKGKIIGGIEGYEKGFTWSNSKPKVGLMKDDFGKSVNINAKISSDLMITEVYFYGKDYKESSHVPDYWNMCSMIEIYNPTTKDINLKDYYISRVNGYVLPQYDKNKGRNNAGKVTLDYLDGGAPEEDNGGPGYNLHPYGYYPRGYNWNLYGFNPYVARYFQPSNISQNTLDYTALLQCLDVTHEKISHTILGDEEFNIAHKIWKPSVDKFGLWEYYNDNVSAIQNSPQAVMLKGNETKWKKSCEYIWPVRYKLHPYYKDKNVNLKVLKPGKTAVFCGAYYRKVFIDKTTNEYPEQNNFGLETLDNNMKNGNCQFVVAVDNARYYYSYYDIREEHWNSYSTSGSSSNGNNANGHYGSTMNVGWKSGLRLLRRVIFKDEQDKPSKIAYKPVDLFGPTNIISPNQDEMEKAWAGFTVRLIPKSKRWYVARKNGIRKSSNIFHQNEWYTTVLDNWYDPRDQNGATMGSYNPQYN